MLTAIQSHDPSPIPYFRLTGMVKGKGKLEGGTNSSAKLLFTSIDLADEQHCVICTDGQAQALKQVQQLVGIDTADGLGIDAVGGWGQEAGGGAKGARAGEQAGGGEQSITCSPSRIQYALASHLHPHILPMQSLTAPHRFPHPLVKCLVDVLQCLRVERQVLGLHERVAALKLDHPGRTLAGPPLSLQK